MTETPAGGAPLALSVPSSASIPSSCIVRLWVYFIAASSSSACSSPGSCSATLACHW